MLCIGSNVLANDSIDKLGITLGNPWIGLQYNLFSRTGLEVRYSLDPEVKLVNFRGNYDLIQKNPYSIFAGLDYGSFTFDCEGITGTGSAITPFLGASYTLNKKISISTDLGYSIISVESGNASLSGPEYAFNIWLTVYPFSHKQP